MTLQESRTLLADLCRQDRRMGSAANQKATRMIADRLKKMGFGVQTQPFFCLEWQDLGSSLRHEAETLPVHAGPYSHPCDLKASFKVLRSLDMLRTADLEGQVAVLSDDLCQEQLMPKNFVFYNPESHQTILRLLEEKKPRAIVAATEKCPETVGALDPFPVIEDGDFAIPSAFMKRMDATPLLEQGQGFLELTIGSSRKDSHASNVIATLHEDAPQQMLFCAHLDSKPHTPGALDNAAGVIALLELAERLSDLPMQQGVQLVFFNGEDDYSAAGQMHYLKTRRQDLENLEFCVNLDGVGHRGRRMAYSLLAETPKLRQASARAFSNAEAFVEGPIWMQGDHMIFAQQGLPCVAICSENLSDILQNLAHTPRDVPEGVDVACLHGLAKALRRFIQECSP